MNKINQALTLWDKNKDMTEFLRKKLGEQAGNGKTHADELIDNALTRAKVEEKPDWTRLLLDAANSDDKKSGTQINLFAAIAESTNENIDELIDVTPKNKIKTIDDLI